MVCHNAELSRECNLHLGVEFHFALRKIIEKGYCYER